MAANNFYRMITLADEFFLAKTDSSQIDIDESVIERITALHPSCMGEIATDDGPIAWTIVVPVSTETMNLFLSGTINESDLLNRSEKEGVFEAVYLCSALVLPEHRRKGLSRKLLTESIQVIRKDHGIRALFYWGFSPEGNSLARSVARGLSMPIFERKSLL